MKQISTDKAPAAIGPYSQGFVSGNILFSAGQIALDPAPERSWVKTFLLRLSR